MERTTIKQLEDRIAGKVQISDIDDFIIKMYHVFMTNYGYIPYEDFMNMPYGVFKGLFEEIRREGKLNKSSLKGLKKHGSI